MAHQIESNQLISNMEILQMATYKIHKEYTDKCCISGTLNRKGYTSLTRLCNALQGSIWKTCKDGAQRIVKVIHKSLYHKHITYLDHKEAHVQEDIIKEATILKYLTNSRPPPSLAQYIDFFEDINSYYFVMDYCGQNFFEFVQNAHQYIQKGALDTSTWLEFCKHAMKQMVDIVQWLHSMNTAHLDISLENFTINNVKMTIDKYSNQIIGFDTDFQIKIIDFGLAEIFPTDYVTGITDFRCRKYVGKTRYQSPEVYAKQHTFDAQSADSWSLGITFFMMVSGGALFHKPSPMDRNYCMLVNGQMRNILFAWNKLDCVSPDILDLLQKMLVIERYRPTLKDIRRHPVFLNLF
eukprot:3166_1